MSNERFGLIATPVEYKDKAVDGELLVNRNDGHIYVKKDKELLSKTVENEKRIKKEEIITHHTTSNLILGAGDWSPLIEAPDYANYSYDEQEMCMNLSGNKGNLPAFFIFDVFINIINGRKYLLKTELLNNSNNYYSEVNIEQYDKDYKYISSLSVGSIKNEIIFGNFDGSTHKFNAKTAFIRIQILTNNLKIRSLEFSLIPSYVELCNPLKNLFVMIDANYPFIEGPNYSIKNLINFKDYMVNNISLKIPFNKSNNEADAYLFNLKKLRFGVYSLVIRFKADKNIKGKLFNIEYFFNNAGECPTKNKKIEILSTHINQSDEYTIISCGLNIQPDADYEEIEEQNWIFDDIILLLELYGHKGETLTSDELLIDYISITPANSSIFAIDR